MVIFSNIKSKIIRSDQITTHPKNKLANPEINTDTAKMSGDQKTLINGSPSQYVKLNVGGCLYHTTIATLTSKQDTMLRAMFSGRMEVLSDSEGLSFLYVAKIDE